MDLGPRRESVSQHGHGTPDERVPPVPPRRRPAPVPAASGFTRDAATRAPPPARRPGPLGPSPLAQPGRALPGAQGLESFLGQESEVIAAQVAGLPGSHGGPDCAEVGLLP